MNKQLNLDDLGAFCSKSPAGARPQQEVQSSFTIG